MSSYVKVVWCGQCLTRCLCTYAAKGSQHQNSEIASKAIYGPKNVLSLACCFTGRKLCLYDDGQVFSILVMARLILASYDCVRNINSKCACRNIFNIHSSDSTA